MNNQKQILIILLLTFSCLKISATQQVLDVIIYGKEKLFAYLYLPTQLQNSKTKLFGNKTVCESTACSNGYNTRWCIIGNQLYLTDIYSCCYDEDGIKADLKSLFKEKYKDGKVKADWVTSTILAKKGKFIAFRSDFEPIFEKEVEFGFKKGKVLVKNEYVNSKSKVSAYSQDYDKLSNYIYSHINWNIIPVSTSQIRVILQFEANEKGKVSSVKLMRGSSELYNKEAIRVIKGIPEWDVFFSKGKLLHNPWTMAVIFSEENRKMYKK